MAVDAGVGAQVRATQVRRKGLLQMSSVASQWQNTWPYLGPQAAVGALAMHMVSHKGTAVQGGVDLSQAMQTDG